MLRFLRNILFFAAAMLLSLWLLELYARRQEDPIKIKQEYIDRHADSITTIFIGESQMYWAIDPALWGNGHEAVNLCHNGLDARMQCLILLNAVNRLPSLQRVFIGLDYCVLFDPLTGENGPGRYTMSPMRYFRFDTIPDFVREYFNPSSPRWYEIANREQFDSKVVPWRRPDLAECDSAGHAQIYPRSKLRHKVGGIIKPDPYILYIFDYLDLNLKFFHSMLHHCKEHNLEIIIVIPPLFEEFFYYYPRIKMEKIYEMADSFHQEYGARVMDYCKDPRISSDLFIDVTHMASDTGSRVFTRILQEDYLGGDSLPLNPPVTLPGNYPVPPPDYTYLKYIYTKNYPDLLVGSNNNH